MTSILLAFLVLYVCCMILACYVRCLCINIFFGSGVRLFYVGGKMEACLGVIGRHLSVRLDRKFEE